MDGRNAGLYREGHAVQRWIYWMIIPFQASTVAIKIKMFFLLFLLKDLMSKKCILLNFRGGTIHSDTLTDSCEQEVTNIRP